MNENKKAKIDETKATEEALVAEETVKSEAVAAETAVVNADGKKPKEKKKKGAKSKINLIINIVLIVAIIIAAICTYVSFVTSSGQGAPNIFGYRLLSIQTPSMYPTFKSGDLIIDVGVDDPEDLRTGDIITYWTVIESKKVLNTHRIVNIYDGGGYLIFETKGDNNTDVDPLTVHESEIIGKYKYRLKGVGKVFDYLQSSKGFLVVVLIPVFVFFIYHLVQFFRVLFEYQNVKNRIKYEQERGKTEDLLAERQKTEEGLKAEERAKIEAELREKLKAELLESMKKEQAEGGAAPSEKTE